MHRSVRRRPHFLLVMVAALATAGPGTVSAEQPAVVVENCLQRRWESGDLLRIEGACCDGAPCSEVSDADLQQLSGKAFAEVAEIRLRFTRVSESGLAPLRQLAKLKRLRWYTTAVPASHRASVEAMLPGVEIEIVNPVRPDGMLNLELFRSSDGAHLGLFDVEESVYRCEPCADKKRFVIDDRVFRQLAEPQYANIEGLWLNKTRLSDEGLRRISVLPKLKKLDINETRISDEGLRFMGRMKALERVYMEDTPITGAGFAHLKEAPSLAFLGLRGNCISAQGLRALGEVRQLKEVLLNDECLRFAYEEYQQLRTKLRAAEVTFQGTFRRRDGRADLRGRLSGDGRLLNLFGWNNEGYHKPAAIIREEDFVQLREKDFSEVAVLRLSPWFPGAADHVAHLKKLSSLHVRGYDLAELGLGRLAALPIEELELEFQQAADRDLASLQALRLAALRLHCANYGDHACKLTGAGLRQVPRDAMRSFVSIRNPLSDEGLQNAADWPLLERLDLAGAPLSGGFFRSASFPELSELILDSSAVTDGALEYICRLPKLAILKLGNTAIGDAGAKNLAACRKLKQLDLQTTDVSDSAVPHLAELPLADLSLGNTDISDDGIKALSAMGSLERLNLAKTRVTNAAFPQLGKLPRLRRLDVGYTYVTEEGIRRFIASYPPEAAPAVAGEHFYTAVAAKAIAERDYEVYRAALCGKLDCESAKGPSLLVLDQVAAPIDGQTLLKLLGAGLGGEFRSTAEEIIARGRAQQDYGELQSQLKIKRPYVIKDRRLERKLADKSFLWFTADNEYGKPLVLVSVSIVVYDAAGEYAVVEISRVAAPLAGRGELLILKRVGAEWRIVGGVELWIS